MCHPHLYADDTQIQGSYRPGSADKLQSTLSACLDVSDWMRSNRLQLNTAKTEILWCSTTRRQNHLPSAAVRVGENHVRPMTTVRVSRPGNSHRHAVSHLVYGVRMFCCRRIADEYCGGAAVTKFPTKYFRVELCVESLLCE